MFYVLNVKQWLEEVLLASQEKNLDPQDSIFILLVFSSLDFSFTNFFRKRRRQISEYSGHNVHIITPMIFQDDTVRDDDWRRLTDGFSDSGIKISNRPSAIIFRLEKRVEKTGYEPRYIAAFELPEFSEFEPRIRDLVSICIARRQNETRLTHELTTLFESKNLVRETPERTPLSDAQIEEIFYAPRVFISYSSADIKTVLKLRQEFVRRNVLAWVDKFELTPAEYSKKEIDTALRHCDALVVVLSRNSKQSNWIAYEGAFFSGDGRDRPVFPIVLDEEGKAQANNLPFLRDRVFVDLSNPELSSNSLQMLLELLADLGRSN